MPAALMSILVGAAPSLISVGSLAGQEALLNSSLNTVGLDGLFWVGFLTSVGIRFLYNIEKAAFERLDRQC